jgi:hypothetical protein
MYEVIVLGKVSGAVKSATGAKLVRRRCGYRSSTSSGAGSESVGPKTIRREAIWAGTLNAREKAHVEDAATCKETFRSGKALRCITIPWRASRT